MYLKYLFRVASRVGFGEWSTEEEGGNGNVRLLERGDAI